MKCCLARKGSFETVDMRAASPEVATSFRNSMQSDSGLLRWLKVPFLYNPFQDVGWGNALRRRLIQNHVRAKPGDKVIDIGCGPAQALRWFPDVEYLGFDTNAQLYCFCQAADVRQQGDFCCWRHALASWRLAI